MPLKQIAILGTGKRNPMHHQLNQSLKQRLASKTLCLVNLTEADYFHPLKKWLEEKGYFSRIGKMDLHLCQDSPESIIQKDRFNFIFLNFDSSPEIAIKFATMARQYSPQTKIIIFYSGAFEDFKELYKAFKQYDRIYENSSPDFGYARLRGALQRALE